MKFSEFFHRITDRPWKRDLLLLAIMGFGYMSYQIYQAFPQTKVKPIFLADNPTEKWGEQRTKKNQLTLIAGDITLFQNGYCVPTDTVQYYFSKDLVNYYIQDKDLSYLRMEYGFQNTVEQYYAFDQSMPFGPGAKARFKHLLTTAKRLAVQIRLKRDENDQSKR